MVQENECYRNFLVLAAVLIDRRYIFRDGTQVERTYTNRSQLNQLKYNSAVIDTRTYDLGARLSTSTYSNGAVTTWNYRVSGANKDNLLANIATTNPGANKVGAYAYTWDANRNKTAETITNSPLSGFGFSTGSNGYDNENRVTAWNRSDSNQNQTWNLSLVGNWNTFNQTGTGPFNQTRTHGLAHEFISFTGTSSGALTHDVKGNLISRPATLAAPALNLTWDFDNRLGGADTDGTPASNEVTFQYDALGRRVARTESSITTVFVQAGQQTFADYTSGAAPSSPTYRYVYGDYVDELVMRETASGNVKHFYHRNQQYSITALTDSAGNTVERYTYTSHGVLTIFNGTGTQISISALSNRYTWTGREWDSATVLYHFRARTYDPGAGRFINRDLLGYIDGMSLYRGYFGIGGYDPFGLFTDRFSFSSLYERALSRLARIEELKQTIANKIQTFVESDGEQCVDLTAELEEIAELVESYAGLMVEMGDRVGTSPSNVGKYSALTLRPGDISITDHFPVAIGQITNSGNRRANDLSDVSESWDTTYDTLWWTDKGCTVVGCASGVGAIVVGVKKGGVIVLCKVAGTFATGYVANHVGCEVAKACGASENQIHYTQAALDIINLAIFKYRMSKKVRGYRSVSWEEATDIDETGGYRQRPDGLSFEGKWFSESREGALKQQMELNKGLGTIVEADVPKWVYDESYWHENIDDSGPGFCVPEELVPKIIPRGR